MILITCCNLNSGLYLFDEQSNKLEQLNDYECRGLSLDEDGNIYILSHDINGVYKFNKKFELIQISESINHDIHGSCYYKNKIYVVDTFLDIIHVLDSNTLEIIDKYEFHNPAPVDKEYLDEDGNVVPSESISRQFFIDDNGDLQIKNNFFHINDIYIDNDIMYLTMFRDHSNYRLAIIDKTQKFCGTLKSRSIHDQSHNLGNTLIQHMTQPHSPIVNNNNIYCCNSREMTVTSTDKLNFLKGDAFLRGLEFVNDQMYIGLSTSGKRKSDPNFNSEFNECKVEVYDRNTYTKLNEIHIPSDEVYAIRKI